MLYNVVGNEINRRKWGFIYKPGRMGIMIIEVFNPSYGYIKSQGPLKSNSRCSIIKNKWNNDWPLFLAGNHSHRTEPVADIVFFFIFSRQYEERQLRSQQERAQRRLEFSNQESRLMNQVGKKCDSTHLFNLPNWFNTHV